MLNIVDIEKSVPARTIKVREATDELTIPAKEARLYERFFGLDDIPCDPAMPVDILTNGAAARLRADHGETDMVVHCHTLLSAGPCRSDGGHPIKLFNPDEAETFSATMCHCASGVAVFEMIDNILPEDGTAMVVISDKAFHPAVRHIKNTTIMGEGAVAIRVGRGPGRFRYIDGYTERQGAYSVITGHLGDETDLDFADEYVNFTVYCIERALEKAGVDVADLRWVMPHNVNVPSWEQIAARIGADRAQVYLSNIGNYGHTFGADPFLNLIDADRAGELQPGDKIALVSVGLGATASCAVFEVES